MAVGGIIALPLSVSVYNKWRVALNAESYTRQVFIVDDVGVSHSGGSKARTYVWAEGSINNEQLTVGLAGFGYNSRNTPDLRRELPKGTKLDVWYDPSAANVITQGRTLNVLPGDVDLENATKQAVMLTLFSNGLLLLGLSLWFIQKSSK